jgi:large subunit ribosomal protein L7e
LLKKRRRDDLDKKRRNDTKAKQKMAQVRQKKVDEKIKIAGGTKVLLPEVFASNNMKQQRNFVHYKRHKKAFGDKPVENVQSYTLAKEQRVPLNVLLLVVRIKESRNTPPQVQKILNELGLKEVNNCAFIMSTPENVKRILLIADYVGYGQPTKQVLDEVIRKRGYLKTVDHKRKPISDNVLIEELMGEAGIICIEDMIDALWNCKKNNEAYEAVKKALWPVQLAPLKETIEQRDMKHEATNREIKRRNTLAKKGGYLGMMGSDVNEFVAKLI